MELITGNDCLTWDMVKKICRIKIHETEDKCFYRIKIHNEVLGHTWRVKVNCNHSSQYDIMTILANPNKTRHQIIIHRYIRESQLEQILGEIKI